MNKEPQRVWSMEDSPSADDLAIVQGGVRDWGRSQAAGGNPLPIACFVRERGEIVAGACGRTEFRRLFVTHLWVNEAIRGQGIGTESLQRLENAARNRGMTDSLIETLDERVSRLYRDLGYVEISVIHEYVGHFDKHVLVKIL